MGVRQTSRSGALAPRPLFSWLRLPSLALVVDHRAGWPSCFRMVCRFSRTGFWPRVVRWSCVWTRARLLSLYLPPGEQGRVLPLLAASFPEDGMALFAAGDANLQFARPRDGEAEAVAGWRELFNRHAATLLDYAGPSCFGRGGFGH